MTVTPTRQATPELKALANLFYLSLDELGTFVEVDTGEVPERARRLLWHDEHMTVTVEHMNESPVDVSVLNTHRTRTHYSRRIVLHRQSDQKPVLFGIVRLSLDLLPPRVREEIESQETPLGRILIQHNVLRHVRPLSLWKVQAGADLQQHLQVAADEICYGRTALIYCNSLPAVELLEVVTS